MSSLLGGLRRADRHGAVVVPADTVKKIPEAVDLLARREAVIIGDAQTPGFTMEKLKKAIGDAEEIH